MKAHSQFIRLLLVFLVLLCAGCGSRRGTDPKETARFRENPYITVAWKTGLPAQRFREFCKRYTTETGVEVRVGEIPEDYFHQGVMDIFDKYSKTIFDAVVADSYWLAGAAEKGYFANISEFLKRETSFDRVHTQLRTTLSEYPPESGSYYAAPIYPDFMVLLYRKDLYANQEIQEDYESLFGTTLLPPATLEDLQRQAGYFNRAADQPAGLALLTSRRNHDLVLTFQALLELEGGRLADPNSYRVQGVLNSSNAFETISLMRDLISCGPPGASDLSEEPNALHFLNGNTVLSLNWLSVAEGMVDAMGSEKVGVLPLPEGVGGRRVAPLIGYGVSVSSKLSSERQAMCLQFLRWFYQSHIQAEWVKSGGFPVMEADVSDYTHELYGDVYQQSIQHARIFWQVKVYDQLMPVLNRNIGDAVDGYVPPQKALDNLALQWELILREAELLQQF
jgi:ABC-type glycerol-3-phosphate transport system substrate-binding protein